MTLRAVSVVRWTTGTVVVAFLAVLGWYLAQPGFTWTRLVFFAVLGGTAVAGAAGIVYQREVVAAGSAFGLFLLGFWQAVLWIYVLPVSVMLLVAAVLVADRNRSPATG